jgi:D-alanyl-lipoteichoic acid acyltransferase DltB (MBOAT superfamily)
MAFVPIYILILAGTIFVDYFAGIFIEKNQGKKRRMFLIASLIANIGVLAMFKYYNFLNDNLTQFLGIANISNPMPALKILLPIGLSFHTFQAMSYTIEVYRGHQKAERHFGIYALYVMFYPQLVAGPIERPQNLLHQFREYHTFDYDLMVEGLKQMAWGFFKKLVIADRLSIYVNAVYGHVDQHNGITLLVATFFFAFQVYCDFSGYSDIAIGAAKVMGFNLMTNFKRPFLSTSVSEFWKRWHISLSTWFRDYLYISLGGNRVAFPRLILNLFIVFVISGLWHGASWTYVIWGGLNGAFLVSGIITDKWKIGLSSTSWNARFPVSVRIFQTLSTFILMCFSFIFFRAAGFSDACLIISKIIHFDGPLFLADSKIITIYNFGIIALLLLIEIKQEYFNSRFTVFGHENHWVQKLAYASLLVFIIVFGVFDGSQFIYFQF